MTLPLALPAPECDAVLRQLWDYLDGALDATSRRPVEVHLPVCAVCLEHYAFAADFLALVRDRWPDVGDTDAIRARLVARLEAEGFRAA